MAYAKFDPDKTEFLAACLKCHGNVVAIAQEMRVSHDTIYQYINRDAEAKIILDDARGINDKVILDLAIHVQYYNLSQYKSNPKLAQRASEKVLDIKGHERGWKAPNASDVKDDPQASDRLDEFFKIVRKAQGESSDLSIDDNNINAAQKSE